MTAYVPREIAPRLEAALAAMPVVVLTGLRQVGKTTFLREDETCRSRRYLSLDDFATLEAARREPEALIAGDEPLTIDEAQRCPDLLVVIKRAVDRNRVPGRFLLSGSASFGLLHGVGESLAGRALHLTLEPFTRREREGRSGSRPFLLRFLEQPSVKSGAGAESVDESEILEGGMPSVVLGETTDRELWHLGYEQTYLERDLRELSQVADLVLFRNLVRLAVLRSGQILNQSELARDARMPVSTVSRYLGLLEASFLLRRLPPHLRSRATRLIKSPKLYFTDSGLAAHLSSVRDLSAAADEPMRGALVETWVLQNLSGLLGAHRPRAELGFWSVQGRYEVDLIVGDGRSSVGIEVKASSRFHDGDLRGLRAFASRTPDFRAGVLAYNGTEAVSLGDDLFAIPIGLLVS